MPKQLALDVVTPEGTLYRGDASFVVAPAVDGEVGILPGHTALISQLGIGVLRIRREDEGGERTDRFAVRGGFVQVLDDKVMLLATLAVAPEDLDAEALRAEHDEVLEALQHPATDEKFADLLARRRWVETRQALVGA